ncbi:MAG: DegT/DnrJ/EryC1/StrS family aminotransferase [Phycisphaerae bacterium]|jgi:dTDP-4-amino-4,6-dideoxygalactose transaminase
MKVPFLDLKAQYQEIKDDVQQALGRVLESCQFVLGDEVAAFEREFATHCGTTHAIAVNSGTSALHLALLAAGIQPGDEVITVPHTFVATVAAIRYAQARPVFVDIDPVSYTMDPGQLEAAITPRTKAIMPVHLYGQPADMDPILATARRHKLAVIEDAAQAHGARYRDRPAGSMGDIGCFSFYPGKNLGAYGEGGCVVTNNDDHAAMIRKMRDWGQARKHHHELPGYNYRMDGFQGAVLRVKLRRLEAWTEARRSHAALYTKLLADSGVVPPKEMDYSRHVYHVYGICTPEREALISRLQAAEIGTNLHYPIPAHLQGFHADLGYKAGDFPVSERVAREELSLPMFAELSEKAVRHVVEVIRGG